MNKNKENKMWKQTVFKTTVHIRKENTHTKQNKKRHVSRDNTTAYLFLNTFTLIIYNFSS